MLLNTFVKKKALLFPSQESDPPSVIIKNFGFGTVANFHGKHGPRYVTANGAKALAK